MPVKQSPANSGSDMYKQYCASCHGLTGKGDGPAAAALKNPPSDITLMARHNSGRFPAMRVQNILEGKESPAAHGSSDMPVWGPILRHLGGGDQTGSLRIFNLTKHLESMQAR